jgi:NAD(P)-dependent dehydrogenase (short-subunit alcohol dehydrogenase family)
MAAKIPLLRQTVKQETLFWIALLSGAAYSNRCSCNSSLNADAVHTVRYSSNIQLHEKRQGDVTMTGLLEGKTALITGGGRGIGRETAVLFARQGARVVVADLTADGTQETVALINKAGGQAISIVADVTKPADVTAIVATSLKAFGRLDCAFNNAGIAPYQVAASGQRTHEWSEESFERMVAVNLTSVWRTMKAELEVMLKQGVGSIINTASIAGLVGLRTSSAYVAAKHGVIGLTKTAAIEYAKDGIRVNAVCPGFIATDMTKDTMARRGAEILAMVPANRMGTPQEIAEIVCWLASDRASFVTGSAYTVDGAYTAA